MVCLIAEGKKTEDVADFLQISPHWVRQTVKKFNEHGAGAMKDKRRKNPGNVNVLLTTEQVEDRR